MQHIPVLVPKVPTLDKFSQYLAIVDEQKQYSNFGPLNELLLKRLSIYFKVPRENIVTVANATLSIEGACATDNLDKSSHNVTWVAPSWTFSASIAGLLNANAEVVFRDVADDYRVIVKKSDSHLLDVLPFGAGVDFSRYNNILESVIVDGAASFDALCGVGDELMKLNLKVGIIVSLHATKNLPAGEGGIFISNDSNWVENVRRWSNFGMDSNRISNFLGTNAKLDEYSSAVCLAALDEWQGFKIQMSQISKCAQHIEDRLNLIGNHADAWKFITPYWIIELEDSRTKLKLQDSLKLNNIGFKDWWESGCHNMPAYRTIGNEGLTNTLRISGTSLGLPFHYFLTKSDFSRIEAAIASI